MRESVVISIFIFRFSFRNVSCGKDQRVTSHQGTRVVWGVQVKLQLVSLVPVTTRPDLRRLQPNFCIWSLVASRPTASTTFSMKTNISWVANLCWGPAPDHTYQHRRTKIDLNCELGYSISTFRKCPLFCSFCCFMINASHSSWLHPSI